jgi:hypothetical protein
VKVKATQEILAAYADALEAAGAGRSAAGVRQICAFLSRRAKMNMSELVGHVENARPYLGGNACASSQATASSVVTASLRGLNRFMIAAKSKTDVRNDLSSLVRVLELLPESDDIQAVLDRLEAAMNTTSLDPKVAEFIARLNKETGSDDFERSFAELKASALTRQEVVEIAVSVYGQIKKSTSRMAALAYIRKPHDVSVSTRRGIDATGGRSAA